MSEWASERVSGEALMPDGHVRDVVEYSPDTGGRYESSRRGALTSLTISPRAGEMRISRTVPAGGGQLESKQATEN